MKQYVVGRGLVLLVMLGVGCAPAAPPEEAPGPVHAGPGAEVNLDSVPHLQFLTLNIWHDQQDWPARLEVMAEQLRAESPDVICLQEVLQDEGLPNQAETLAERLGYTAHFASWDSAGSVKRYGNAILTRTPILEDGQQTLEPRSDARVVAWARIAPRADTLRADTIDVYCTHLHHTQTAEGEAMRREQLLDALDYIDMTRGDGPTIFAGDFNAPVDAPEMRAVGDRFIDAYGTVHGDSAEAVTTLNTDKGHRSVRIDHVFYRSGRTLALVPTAAEVVLDQPSGAGVWASDHFGVLVDFARVQEAPLLHRSRRPPRNRW